MLWRRCLRPLPLIEMNNRAAPKSAGVIIIKKDAGGYLFLLLRAYRNWDFPKGVIEPGEAPLHAACREVEEETTLRHLHFKWGEDFQETLPYARGKIVRYYLAEVDPGHANVALPISPELGRPEHDEFRWVTYQEAVSLVAERLKPILAWANEKLSN